MRKHVDNYSNLIEQIQFHLPHDKRWNDESINRRFIRNLEMAEWLPWIHAISDRIATMNPVELYSAIILDDEALHGPVDPPRKPISQHESAAKAEAAEVAATAASTTNEGRKGRTIVSNPTRPLTASTMTENFLPRATFSARKKNGVRTTRSANFALGQNIQQTNVRS
jgi:hypothetical protein